MATIKVPYLKWRSGRPRWEPGPGLRAKGHAGRDQAKEFPGLERKWFSDLRDTAITRLALAGCTVPEIRAITGHSLATVHSVLKHYLALDERSAQAGIDRLKAWMVEEGIAV